LTTVTVWQFDTPEGAESAARVLVALTTEPNCMPLGSDCRAILTCTVPVLAATAGVTSRTLPTALMFGLSSRLTVIGASGGGSTSSDS